jgi:hypothetical protein
LVIIVGLITFRFVAKKKGKPLNNNIKTKKKPAQKRKKKQPLVLILITNLRAFTISFAPFSQAIVVNDAKAKTKLGEQVKE